MDDEVVRFLSDAHSYGESGPVERVETHCAVVFLIGTRALKLKKPVRFAYLDFSSPALRHAALARELELNRRTAPMIYRRLLAVTREPCGRLALGGEGEPVDWVLEMVRFDEAGRLDHVADRGGLTERIADALADAVSAAHRDAPVLSDGSFGGVAANRRLCDIAARELAQFAGKVFDAAGIARIDSALRAAVALNAALLDRRMRAGFVRRCHGDLHLGNVVLIEGRPVLFDAIEFSEDIGTMDVLYDLAFLLMDLSHRGLPAIASRVFNRYLENCPLAEAEAMLDGLALMPFFIAYRAIVRAHVEARTGAPDAARRYFAEAATHLDPPPPRLIAIGGLSGSGKSTLARALAPRLGRAYGALILRSDVARKRLCGVAPETRLPDEAYRAEMSAAVYGRLYAWTARALAAGETVLLDAVFTRPEDRAAAEAVAERAGASFSGLWLQAPRQTLTDRIEARSGDASDATRAVVERQLQEDTGRIAWSAVDMSGSLETGLGRALAYLAGATGGAG